MHHGTDSYCGVAVPRSQETGGACAVEQEHGEASALMSLDHDQDCRHPHVHVHAGGVG